ncbi:hypothetical protein Tco_0642196 [Tanacetum coccineum]
MDPSLGQWEVEVELFDQSSSIKQPVADSQSRPRKQLFELEKARRLFGAQKEKDPPRREEKRKEGRPPPRGKKKENQSKRIRRNQREKPEKRNGQAAGSRGEKAARNKASQKEDGRK